MNVKLIFIWVFLHSRGDTRNVDVKTKLPTVTEDKRELSKCYRTSGMVPHSVQSNFLGNFSSIS